MNSTETCPTSLSCTDILRILPHRYPMLLVDSLQDIVPLERAVGIKNVTLNEPFFNGHFPERPVMPGVLVIEALAQTSGLLVMVSLNITKNTHSVYFMSIEGARFRKPIYPGDRLELKVQKKQHRQNVWKFEGQACVNGELRAEALYTAMITPISSLPGPA